MHVGQLIYNFTVFNHVKLHTDHIEKSYRGRNVVKGVSIEVNQGEIVGLLGPNGAGKTTSFYMIVGLVKPDAGSVFLDDGSIRFLIGKYGVGSDEIGVSIIILRSILKYINIFSH